MKVMVCYDDKSYDIVEDYCLEYLILTGTITGFSRSDHWVQIGVDTVREEGDGCPPYTGNERRKRPAANSAREAHQPESD